MIISISVTDWLLAFKLSLQSSSSVLDDDSLWSKANRNTSYRPPLSGGAFNRRNMKHCGIARVPFGE